MNYTYEQIKHKMLSYRDHYEARIRELEALSISGDQALSSFFHAAKESILQAHEYAKLIEQDPALRSVSLDVLQDMNLRFYKPIKPGQDYESCYINPDFAVKLHNPDMGQFLSAMMLQFMGVRRHLIARNYMAASQSLDLLFALYQDYLEAKVDLAQWKAQYRDMQTHEIELKSYISFYQRFSPENDYYRTIILDADLGDLRYLYRYGIYVSENDIKMARYLQTYPAEELADIARYIVKSWVDGFVRAKKDYQKKSYANLMIPCGMEALGRLLIHELDTIGITAIVSQPISQGINKQVSYDHRFDQGLALDEELVEIFLGAAQTVLEDIKDLVALQAGPVYVELFGEEPFSPVSKDSAIKLSAEQQQLFRSLSARQAQLYYKYYRRDEASFTIIAFPSPEIGDKFEEIFADTLKINLLDSDLYAKIQQNIIDVLDQADYVHVLGKSGNATDIKVKMHQITDPQHQTNFENCVADVNIPVGEVFTSPVLKGSTGTLHVEDIYLGNLRYYNLKIFFEDGWVKDYSCTNYDDPEKGKKYIHENLLLPHDTLPIGEFAIGTNTTAYQIAKKYDILSLLPILIIEKMGPHFAIGDTCFSHEEDAPHPSLLNGKEMIAVENEKSATRKTDPLGAYTQKHMDITLPYEMLASITAVKADGTGIDIIRDGRFVVPGTEELNKPLDEIK